MQKGLWQRYPLSPYLFVIGMDKLSHLMSQEVDDGVWLVPKSWCNGPFVYHLMFVDDLLLIGQATKEHLSHVMTILNSFCHLSGQQVSNDKTNIYFSK